MAPTLLISSAILLAVPAASLLQQDSGQPAAPAAETPAAEVPEDETRSRVHIVLDRFREIGGELVSEDDATITILRDGRAETYERNKCIAIIPLINVKDGGEDGVVFMRDGSMLDALVLEDGYGMVLVMIEGIKHEIPRDDVAYVRIKPSFEERLAHLRESIRENDLEARIELAKWMAANDQIDLARAELVAVLSMDDHPEAKQLIKLLDARKALDANSSKDPVPLPPKADRMEGIPERKITAEDVNIIRVYEIDFSNPPKVTVKPRTIDALIENHGTHPRIPSNANGREALHGMRDIDKVKLIFDVQARDLYPEIIVESEPHSLDLFRKKVHNAWLIRNCATSGCHGGNDAGRFYLHRYDMKDPRTAFENLLILERLDLGDAGKLIDYENPSRSLIIQYALPATDSRTPHPDVEGYKPVFPSGGGRLQQETERFIRAMYNPRPKYPVEFEPPTQEEPLEAPPAPRVPR